MSFAALRFAASFSLVSAALTGCTSTGMPTGTGGQTDAAATDGSTPDLTTGGAVDLPMGSGMTAITGTLGKLGAVQPIVSSVVISNSGETLIYLGTANIDCTTVVTSRWLGTLPTGSQVVEIVMKGAPKTGQTVQVPPGEVNYGPGGKSSSYEVNAASGSFTFTSAMTSGPVAGSVTATYADGSMISGTFAATFCPMGQNY